MKERLDVILVNQGYAPSREKANLLGQVLGTMLAPITSLAIVLMAICEQQGGTVESAEAAAE